MIWLPQFEHARQTCVNSGIHQFVIASIGATMLMSTVKAMVFTTTGYCVLGKIMVKVTTLC